VKFSRHPGYAFCPAKGFSRTWKKAAEPVGFMPARLGYEVATSANQLAIWIESPESTQDYA
jgi:hypothetical protein